jgi:hypothetical protein
MKKGKNKSASKNNFIHERQNLINKMCNALSLKYNNFFQAANYDTKTLKEDIEKLLSTQYYSKDPRDVFKPIEQNILDIVKQKNPNLQVKVKKARKLPEIKYTRDKYQEADEAAGGIEKEKHVEIKKNNNINQKKGVPVGKKGNNNIKAKKTNEKVKNENKEKKGEINKVNDKQNTNKDKEVMKDVNIDNMPLSESIYKIENEYGVKHTLLDNLKSRIKYDPTVKYLDEEQKQYKKEQEEKKQQKILQQSKYLNELKSQIEEKDKLKEQEKQIKIKELEEIQQKIKSDKEKEQQKKQTEQQKREKLKKNYEQLIQEKEDIKKQQKLQEIKEDKILSEMINQEINNEKQNIIAKKKKVIEESIKLKEINDKLIQEKKNTKKPKDDFVSQDIFALNNSSSSNVIRDRINKRAQEQEAAGNYLKKIYSTREKQNNDIYLIEKEKQDQKKQLEYEMADKNRQNKIEDYRKSLEDTIAMRSLERKKQKEEEDKFRKNLEEEYALYLKEEEQKKIKKFEQYENYRKALEEQIKDNRIREMERLKNQ